MPNLYFGKVFFQLACRIILGPPKHVLHFCQTPEGGLAKDHTFSGFSFVQPSLTYSVFSSSEWM